MQIYISYRGQATKHSLHTVHFYELCQNPFVTKVARTLHGESLTGKIVLKWSLLRGSQFITETLNGIPTGQFRWWSPLKCTEFTSGLSVFMGLWILDLLSQIFDPERSSLTTRCENIIELCRYTHKICGLSLKSLMTLAYRLTHKSFPFADEQDTTKSWQSYL